MSNVIKFFPANAAENPDAVLEQSIGEYQSVVVIGYDHDGELDVRASTNIDNSDVSFLVGLFMHKLYNGDYHE